MLKGSTPVLLGTVPSFEMFMTSWEQLPSKTPCLKPLVQPGLDLAYKFYDWMDRTVSYIIAWVHEIKFLSSSLMTLHQVLNPTMQMNWVQYHWETHYIDEAKKKVIELVCN